MDLDDSTDKVRRNVVVFASAIIAVTVLKVSVTHGTLFGLEIKTASPGRVWLLFLLAALYLLLRFHFDGSTKDARTAAGNEFVSGMRKELSSFLKQKLLALILKKDETARKYVDPIQGTLPFELMKRTNITNLRMDFEIVETNGEADWPIWRRIARLRKTDARAMNFSAEFVEAEDEYTSYQMFIPIRTHSEFAKVFAKHLLWVLYSKGLVDVLVPYLLGLIALGICTIHVGKAAFSHL